MIPFNQLVATRYGHMIVHAHDMYVGQSLQLFGEFSPGEMDLYHFLLEPGDMVVEVGANLGALTVPIAQRVGERGVVIAYEPQRATYQALCGNLALNSLPNVVAHNNAVGATLGATHVPAVNLTTPDNVGGVEMDPTRPPNVAVTTLDADLGAMPRLALLKIDVEGMEADVLAGAAQLIARTRPVIVAEVDREGKKELTLAWLRAHDYRLYAHNPPLYREPNWRGVTDLNPWPGVVSFNVVAVPAERKPFEPVVLASYGLIPMEDTAPDIEEAA